MNKTLRTVALASAPLALAAIVACGPPQASGIQACPNPGSPKPTVLVTVSARNTCPPGGWNVKNPGKGGQGSQNFPCGAGLASKAEDDRCVSFVENFTVSATDLRVAFTVLATGPGWMTKPHKPGATQYSTGIKPVAG